MPVTENIKKSQRLNLTLLLTGTILFILYYLADCALDSLIFGEGTFTENLMNPTAHEVAIRTLSGIFLFTLYIVSSVLINKNRNLQMRLLVKTEEILEANRELDAYNAALSQELKSSITRIMLSKEKLKFDCFQCDSQRGKKFLEQLSEDCDTLSERMADVLKFSEINRAKLDRKRVAIDDLARGIARDISASTDGQPLNFHIDNNLETDCDPELMQIALKNLLDCSVRKSFPHQLNEIRIGMKKREGVPIYFIRTSTSEQPAGPSASPGRAAPDSTAQNVINIKTARTIIERHGGQLWAKDSAQKNPSFYFTL